MNSLALRFATNTVVSIPNTYFLLCRSFEEAVHPDPAPQVATTATLDYASKLQPTAGAPQESENRGKGVIGF